VVLTHATNRCISQLKAGDSVKLNIHSKPALTVCGDTAVFKHDSAFLYASVDGPQPHTFTWTPAANLYTANEGSTYTRPMTGSRVFRLTASNAYGCDTTAEVYVRVMDSCLESLRLEGPGQICADSLITYRAVVTGGLTPVDYTITWMSDPLINGIVDSVNAPFIKIRPDVGNTRLYVTVTDISAHAAKCPKPVLVDSLDIRPSEKQTLTASIELTTPGEFCAGTQPMAFRVTTYADGEPWTLNGRYHWYRVRNSRITNLGYGAATYTAYDAQDGDRFFAVAEADYRECLYNYTAATDTLTVSYLPYPPAFGANKAISYGLINCSPDTAAIEIVMDEDRSLFEYSIDSGLTFQASPIFSPVDEGDYYAAVRYTGGTCVRFSDVLLHIHIAHDSLPRLTPAPDADYCVGDTMAALKTRATVAGAIVRWYAEDSCETLLGEGDSLDINAMELGVGLHTFYARQEMTNCKGLSVGTLVNVVGRDTAGVIYTFEASDLRPCLTESVDLYFLPDIEAGFNFNGTVTLTVTPLIGGVLSPANAYTQTYTPDIHRVPDTLSVPMNYDTVVVTAAYNYTTLCEDEARTAYATDTLTLMTFGPLAGHVITAEQLILRNETPDTLRGTIAEGERPDYQYGWIEYTADPATDPSAAGVLVGTEKNHAPEASDVTRYFRRIAYYGTGACPDTSNTVRVAVRDKLHLLPQADTVCAGMESQLTLVEAVGLSEWYLLYSPDGSFDTTDAGLAQKVAGSENLMTTAVAESGYYTVIGISAVDGRIFYGDTACVYHQPAIGNNRIGFIGRDFSSDDTIVCPGEIVGLHGSLPTGGDGEYRYTYYSHTASGAFAPIAAPMTSAPMAASLMSAMPAAAAVAPTNDDTLFYSEPLTESTWFVRCVESGYCKSFSEDTVYVEIERYREPAVEIDLVNQFCGTEPFTAALISAVDTGVYPTFQWYVNGQPFDGETRDSLISHDVVNGDTVYLVVKPDYKACHCPGPDSILSNKLPVRKSDYMEAFLRLPDTVCEQSVVAVGGRFRVGFNLNPKYTWFIDDEVFLTTAGADTLVSIPSTFTHGVDSLRVHAVIEALSGCNGQTVYGYSDTLTVYVNRVRNNTIAGDTAVCEKEPVQVTGSVATGYFERLSYAYLYSRTAEGPWYKLAGDGTPVTDGSAAIDEAAPAATVSGTTLHIPSLTDTLRVRRIAYSPDRLCADTTEAVTLTPIPYRHPKLAAALSTDRLCGNDNFSIRLVDSTGYLSGNSTYAWYHQSVADGVIRLIGTADTVAVEGIATGDRFWCNVTSTEGCVLPAEQAAVTDTVTAIYKRNSTVAVSADTVVCAGESVELWAFTGSESDAVQPVYTWSNGYVGASQTVQVLAGEPQEYKVTISHPDYCDTTATIIVKAHTLVDSLRLEKNYDTVCSQSSYTFRVLGRPAGLKVLWSTGDTTPTTTPFIVDGDTMFTISYRDVHGCLFEAYDTLRLSVRDGRPIHFTGIDVPDTAIYNEDTPFAVSIDINRDSIRYDWFADGAPFSTVYDTTGFTYDKVNMEATFTSEKAYRVACVLEDYSVCRSQRDTIYDTMFVRQAIYAEVEIKSNAKISNDTIDVCTDATINFSVETVNAGPVAADGSHDWYIEWYHNGQLFATGDITSRKGSDLAEGDKIYAILYCDNTMRPFPANSPVTSDTLTVRMIERVYAEAEIGFVKSDNYGNHYYDTSRYDVCENAAVTAEAHITDGGDQPKVYWYINGTYVNKYDMMRTVTFDELVPVDGKNATYELYAKIVSSDYCASEEDTIVTNVLTVEIHPYNKVEAWVDTLVKWPLCQFEDGSQYVEITAHVRYDDTSATYTYLWYKDGVILRDADNQPIDDTVLRYYPATPLNGSERFMMRMFNTAMCSATSSVITGVVVPVPHAIGAEAGPDGETPAGMAYTLSGDSVYGGRPYWTTSGDGTFVNDTVLHTKYMPGSADSAAGSVMLYLTAFDGLTCSVTDSLELTVQQCNVFTLPPMADTMVCRGAFCFDNALQMPDNMEGITVTYRWEGDMSGELYEGESSTYCLTP
ncbi:MAG: hypothetical protein K2H62_05050, partial [Bacteroidales bacterium]|nr:hypothetical protein [Bacteroidales bacterium]